MSEIKSSWSFVEITPEAREAAERAALAAGMDIDAWLAQLIKYTSAMELKVSEPRPAPRPQSPAPPSLGQQPAAQPPTPASFGQQASAPQLRSSLRPPGGPGTSTSATSSPAPATPATGIVPGFVPAAPSQPQPAAPAFSLSIAPAKPDSAPRGDTPPPPPFSLPNPASRPSVSMPQRPASPPSALALRPAPVTAAIESARPQGIAPAAPSAGTPPPAAAPVSVSVAPAAPAAATVPQAIAAGTASTQGQAALAIQPAPRPAILAPPVKPPAEPPRDVAKETPKGAPQVVEARPEPGPAETPRPEASRADAPRSDTPRMVATDMLHPSRFAALASPKEDDIQAALDKWRASGMLEPLIVRPRAGAPGQFEIISGIDRWHAARRAYVRQIPVLARDANDQEALELGLVDQLRRAPLSPLAEANIYLRLLNDAGLDTERAARLAGKPAAHVATMVRILNLPKPVRALLESGDLTVMHARALLDAPNPEAIARDIVEKRLDIYQTEQLVRISGRAADMVDASVLVDAPTDESIVEMGTAPFARDSRSVPAAPTARRAGEPSAETPPTEGEARALPPPPPASARRPSEARPPREGDVISTDLLERNIANTLGVRCAISERNGVGVITLHYTSREELVRILTRINGGGSAG